MFTEDFLPLHTHIRPSDWAVFNGSTQSGSQLFRCIHPVDILLTTQLQSNVNLYQKLGFKVIEHTTAIEALYPNWTMKKVVDAK
jgi:hypothetical protein